MLQQEKQDITMFQSILKELPLGVTVRHIKRSEVSSKQLNVNSTRVFQSDRRLSISQIQLYEQLEAKVSELSKEIEQDNKDLFLNLIETLAPYYQLGSKLQKIVGIEKINFGENNSFTKEDSYFSAEDGIVYVLHIWFPWKEPCQALMNKNKKMLEKNVDWKGKIKIIGMAVSPDTEYVVSSVNKNNFKSIEHYRFRGWCENECIIKYLSLTKIPFVLLLNKWGKIVYMGHPAETNLEEKINSEINAEQDNSELKQETSENEQQTYELLSKEEYKELKEKMRALQAALKEFAFEGFVNVSLEKINVWQTDGTKEVLKRSKLTLSYDVNVSEEVNINKFLLFHWNTVPENLRHVKEAKVRDPVRQQQKEIKAQIQEAFAALDVTISYTQETHTFTYGAQKQEFKSKTTSGFEVDAQNLTSDLFLSGMENLKDYLAQFEEEENANGQLVASIVSGLTKYIVLGVGKQFETIENYIKWGQNECTKLNTNQDRCFQLSTGANIENNSKLLKKNAEKWGNDVTVVSLSLELAEDAKQYMDSHKESQNLIEFYFPKEEQQPDILKYGVQNFPHYVVVDKFGTIRETQSIDDVEILVTSLLSEEEVVPIVIQKVVNLQIQPTQIQQILTSNVFAQADPQKILQLELILKSKTIEGVVSIQEAELSYFARDTQEQQLKPVFDQLFEIIPENQWNISKKIQKTVSILYPGKDCAVCKKDISNEPQQYYSPFKSEHVCTECAEADDQEKKGNQRYKYIDTLVFINGPLSDISVLNNIDDHKIGTNLKLPDGKEGSQSHPMQCNGCGDFGSVKGPRYISVTARPGEFQGRGYIDYCQICFLQLKDKTSGKAQEIIKNNVEDGMVLDSLFTRVLFNHGGYRDF